MYFSQHNFFNLGSISLVLAIPVISFSFLPYYIFLAYQPFLGKDLFTFIQARRPLCPPLLSTGPFLRLAASVRSVIAASSNDLNWGSLNVAPICALLKVELNLFDFVELATAFILFCPLPCANLSWCAFFICPILAYCCYMMSGNCNFNWSCPFELRVEFILMPPP